MLGICWIWYQVSMPALENSSRPVSLPIEVNSMERVPASARLVMPPYTCAGGAQVVRRW